MTIDNIKTGHPFILYIMGTGRSGTTVLEILISGNEKICSVGELTHIFRDGFGGDNRCACGSAFNQCRFWRQVKERLSYPPQRIIQSAILLNRIDWHTGFLKILLNGISKQSISEYRQINKDLYNACAAVSGKSMIVDSSKYPARAFMLNKMYGSSVKTICLTRSPEGLLNSFQKTNIAQPSKSHFGVFLYYTYVLFCCRVVALLTKNVLFISFEDLIAFPNRTLNKIEAFTGISLDQTQYRIKKNIPFTPGHIVTGNRLKYNKKVYFKNKLNKNPKTGNRIILLFMKTAQKLLGF